jgi:long-chain fatty acid transport protein
MKRNAIAGAVVSALGLLAGSEAHAAAFALYEQGVSGLGNAYAGAAAVAEDATTVWWNPAGMARLGSGKHFAIAGSIVAPSSKFSDGGSVMATGRPLGGNGGDAGDPALIPSLFFAMDLGPRWNFGVGVSVPFGLKTEYDPSWLGRFQGISSEIKTLNINPAVSYKFSEAMSVGFGINYQRAEIETLTAVNLVAAEGQNKSNVDGDAWGFNVGALLNVTPATRLGIHYRSSIEHKLEGTTAFTGGVPAPDGNVKLDVKTPDSLAFSVAHRVNDRWEVLGDLTWWKWSKIKQVPLVRTDGALSGQTVSTFVFNFDDAWRSSIGANYKLDNAWTLKLGAAYDQSPVPNAQSRTVRLPDSDRYWLSAGAKYQLSRNGALDFGYTFVGARNADIDNDQSAAPARAGRVTGSYKVHVHVLGVQYQHTF